MRNKLLAVIAGMSLALFALAAPAHADGVLPPAEPVDTATPYFTACHGSPAEQAASVACTSQVLDAINAQHTAEGISPLMLPADYTAEPVTQQLMQAIGAERASRGLRAPLGLVDEYDAIAQKGATENRDPIPPPDVASGAIWAGGMSTALEADFGWMYDDGPGGHNLECTSGDMTGCWGHRNDILDAHLQQGPAGLYLGTAYSVGARGGGSYAALLAAPPTTQPVFVSYQDPVGRSFAPRPVARPTAHPPTGARLRYTSWGSEPLRAAIVIALIIGLSLVARRRRIRHRPAWRRSPRGHPVAPRVRARSGRPRSQPIIRPLDDGPGPWD